MFEYNPLVPINFSEKSLINSKPLKNIIED